MHTGVDPLPLSDQTSPLSESSNPHLACISLKFILYRAGMDRYLIYFWSHICIDGWMDEYIYKIKHQDDIVHWTYVHTQHFLHGEPLLLPLFPVIHHSSYKGIIMLVFHLSIIPLPSMSICFMMSEDSSPMLSMSSIPERFSNILKNQCDVRSITYPLSGSFNTRKQQLS